MAANGWLPLLEPLLGLIRYMPAPAFSPRCDHIFGHGGELPKCCMIFVFRHPLFNTLMIMDAGQVRARENCWSRPHQGGRGLRVSPRCGAFHRSPVCLMLKSDFNMRAPGICVIVAEWWRLTAGSAKRISLCPTLPAHDEIFVGDDRDWDLDRPADRFWLSLLIAPNLPLAIWMHLLFC